MKEKEVINTSVIFKMQQSVLQQDYSELCRVSVNRELGSTPDVHLHPLFLGLYITIHTYRCCLLLHMEHYAEAILSSSSGLR